MRLALFGALLLSATSTLAQTADPDALLREGVALRRAHRDAEALVRFESAWQLTRSPRALAQVGLAEQAVGRWVAAETHLREALAVASDPWIAANAASLRAALEVIGQHLGDLHVDGPDGAEVWVDGQRVATLPMTDAVRVVAGSVRLEVRASGFNPVSRPLVVAPRGAAREDVRLTRASASQEPTVLAASPAHSAAPVPTVVTAPRGPWRALAWASVAGAVVGVGVGLGAVVARENAATTYNADRGCPGVRSVDAQPPHCQGLVDDVAFFERMGLASLAVGGALAITSIVLFAATPTGDTGTERASLSCGPRAFGWGLTCAGRF